MKYRDQFFLLRDLIKETGLAKIWVYQNNQHFGTQRVFAYVLEQQEPPEIRICVKDETEFSYENSLCDLLHECGHILDFKRYGKTKRYKLCDDFYVEYSALKSDYTFLKNVPRPMRVAVCITEYMAWDYAKKLLEIWDINLNPDRILLEQTAHYQSMIIKYRSRRRIALEHENALRNHFSLTRIYVTHKDIMGLRSLMDKEIYEPWLE